MKRKHILLKNEINNLQKILRGEIYEVIKISDETWKELNTLKEPAETFDNVVHRLLHPLNGLISFEDKEKIEWNELGEKLK